jgi:hypothetical protein
MIGVACILKIALIRITIVAPKMGIDKLQKKDMCGNGVYSYSHFWVIFRSRNVCKTVGFVTKIVVLAYKCVPVISVKET